MTGRNSSVRARRPARVARYVPHTYEKIPPSAHPAPPHALGAGLLGTITCAPEPALPGPHTVFVVSMRRIAAFPVPGTDPPKTGLVVVPFVEKAAGFRVGRSVGIVGLGRIGKAIAERAREHGLRAVETAGGDAGLLAGVLEWFTGPPRSAATRSA